MFEVSLGITFTVSLSQHNYFTLKLPRFSNSFQISIFWGSRLCVRHFFLSLWFLDFSAIPRHLLFVRSNNEIFVNFFVMGSILFSLTEVVW
jgi:hypothetical protein